ncbi:hypothetical protein ACFX2J_045658 [Malus domestica]
MEFVNRLEDWTKLIKISDPMEEGCRLGPVVSKGDEDFNCRAAHWADLHALLYNALPPNLFLWGHHFLSFSISSDKSSVIVKASSHQTNEIIEIVGDLLVAADGCLSSIRQSFVPDHKLRY